MYKTLSLAVLALIASPTLAQNLSPTPTYGTTDAKSAQLSLSELTSY